MKTVFFWLLATGLGIHSFSQQYTINIGKELKLHEASNDLEIVARDKSGIYLQEGRVKTNRLSFNEPYSTVYTLYKFDNNNNLLFSKDYGKDFKGYNVNSFEVLGDKLYAFATDFNKKQKTLTIYATALNKSTGDPEPGIKEIEIHTMEEKDDLRSFTISRAEDGKSFVMVTRINNTDHRTVTVTVLDDALNKTKTVTVVFPADKPIRDVVDHVVLTKGKIFMWARRAERIKVKKDVEITLKNYLLLTYDMTGKKISEVIVECEDKYVTSEEFVLLPDGRLVLTGFYGKDPLIKALSGFFFYTINTGTGGFEKRTFKEITAATFTSQTSDTSARFPDRFVIRSIDAVPPDNGVVITAEHTVSSARMDTDNDITWEYQRQHFLIIRVDKSGETKWVNFIGKLQREIFSVAGISSGYGSRKVNGGGMPYYSSYTSLVKDNKLILLLNDDVANTGNPKYGDKVREIDNFKNTNLYGISVDLHSGSMERKIIAANNGDKILAPRHSLVSGNEIVMPTWKDPKLGKSESHLAVITVE